MPLALKILVARYGLDGAPPRSLEDVALAFGLDRLRQIDTWRLGYVAEAVKILSGGEGDYQRTAALASYDGGVMAKRRTKRNPLSEHQAQLRGRAELEREARQRGQKPIADLEALDALALGRRDLGQSILRCSKKFRTQT